jgi:hypothetical protein
MTDWFGANAYIPHGFCMAWEGDLITAILLSNGLIALACMCIAGSLILKAIAPAPMIPRWLYWAFAAFIFCSGVSHILDDVTLWLPIYRVQALVLATTALVSLFTAMLPLSLWIAREISRRH